MLVATRYFPVRGQLVTVKASWVKTIYHHREHDLCSVAYVIPRKDVVVLRVALLRVRSTL